MVIPVYNSTRALPELAGRIGAIFSEKIKEPYEILFIDDGSPDPETWKTLASLAQQFSSVKAIQLRRNFGRSAAVLCGLQEMKGSWCIVMDDDLQHQPEDIPKLIRKREHDVVFAQFQRKQHGWVTRTGSYITTLVEHEVLGLPPRIRNSAFIMVKEDVARLMLTIKTPHPFIPALILAVTNDIGTVEVDHKPRKYGTPAYTFLRRLGNFSDLIINNSSILLRAVALLGVIVGVLGSFYGLYIFLRSWIYGSSIPGWASVMVAILVLGSLTLITLGVAGEYLLRIIQGIEYRPLFVVKQIAQQNTLCSPLLKKTAGECSPSKIQNEYQ